MENWNRFLSLIRTKGGRRLLFAGTAFGGLMAFIGMVIFLLVLWMTYFLAEQLPWNSDPLLRYILPFDFELFLFLIPIASWFCIPAGGIGGAVLSFNLWVRAQEGLKTKKSAARLGAVHGFIWGVFLTGIVIVFFFLGPVVVIIHSILGLLISSCVGAIVGNWLFSFSLQKTGHR
jgi:hypothetical protein